MKETPIHQYLKDRDTTLGEFFDAYKQYRWRIEEDAEGQNASAMYRAEVWVKMAKYLIYGVDEKSIIGFKDTAYDICRFLDLIQDKMWFIPR